MLFIVCYRSQNSTLFSVCFLRRSVVCSDSEECKHRAETDNIAEILTQLIVFAADSISDSHAPFSDRRETASVHQNIRNGRLWK